jgi:hypothetical protein
MGTTISHTLGGFTLAGVRTQTRFGCPTGKMSEGGRSSVPSVATRMDLRRIRPNRFGIYVARTPVSTKSGP